MTITIRVSQNALKDYYYDQSLTECIKRLKDYYYDQSLRMHYLTFLETDGT